MESMLSWGAGVGTREYSSQPSVDPRGREKKGEERREMKRKRKGEKEKRTICGREEERKEEV